MSQPSDEKILKIGIIGIGNMGFAHAKCLAAGEIDRCRLCAVCDTDSARLAAAQREFPAVERYDSASELFQNAHLDAVIIATPHRLHTALAIEAMRAGLHVLSEKPADVVYTRAEEACRVAAEQHRVYAMMFNQRNHPVYRRLHTILQSGETGNIKRVEWTVTNWYRTQHYYDSGDWRGSWSGEGGGVLLNQAPHNLDLICMLFGLPLRVYAKCRIGKYHRITVEDEAELLLDYGEFTLHFVASTGEFPGTNRMEIATDSGRILVENGEIAWDRLKANERETCFSSEENMPLAEYTRVFPDVSGEDSAHRGILRNFAAAVLDGAPLIACGQDGVNEIMLSNAAYLSAWQGREISLPLTDDAIVRELERRAAEEQPVRHTDAVKEEKGYQSRWQVRW